MKWIKEPIPNTGYFEDMFALRKEEAVLLGKVLKKPLNEYLKRLDKLKSCWRQSNRYLIQSCGTYIH